MDILTRCFFKYVRAYLPNHQKYLKEVRMESNNVKRGVKNGLLCREIHSSPAAAGFFSKGLRTRRNISPGNLELEPKIVKNWPNKV